MKNQTRNANPKERTHTLNTLTFFETFLIDFLLSFWNAESNACRMLNLCFSSEKKLKWCAKPLNATETMMLNANAKEKRKNISPNYWYGCVKARVIFLFYKFLKNLNARTNTIHTTKNTHASTTHYETNYYLKKNNENLLKSEEKT